MGKGRATCVYSLRFILIQIAEWSQSFLSVSFGFRRITLSDSPQYNGHFLFRLVILL